MLLIVMISAQMGCVLSVFIMCFVDNGFHCVVVVICVNRSNWIDCEAEIVLHFVVLMFICVIVVLFPYCFLCVWCTVC